MTMEANTIVPRGRDEFKPRLSDQQCRGHGALHFSSLSLPLFKLWITGKPSKIIKTMQDSMITQRDVTAFSQEQLLVWLWTHCLNLSIVEPLNSSWKKVLWREEITMIYSFFSTPCTYLSIDWGGCMLWLIKINTFKRTQRCFLWKRRQ